MHFPNRGSLVNLAAGLGGAHRSSVCSKDGVAAGGCTVRVVDLGRIGIWTAAFDAHPSAAAQAAAVELEELGYRTLWLNEATGRDPFVMAGLLLSATSTLTVALGIANIYARDAMTTAAAQKTLRRGVPGPLPARARCQQPGPRREGPRARLHQAVHATCRSTSRRWTRRRSTPSAPASAPGARARRPRPEDAGAVGQPRQRRPPVPDHPGAHAHVARRSSVPTRCWPPSRWSCWRPTRRRRGRSVGRSSASTSGRRATSPTCAGSGFSDDDWADPKNPSDRLVDADRGVGQHRRRRSRASTSTSTPAPTTSASRSCAAIARSRCPSGASSLPPCSDDSFIAGRRRCYPMRSPVAPRERPTAVICATWRSWASGSV